MSDIDELEKIKLLLSSEYNNVSNQLISRFTGQHQIYTMGTTLLAGLLGAYFANFISLCVLFGLILVSGAIGIVLWIDIDMDMAKAATRIREIEERVNQFVKEDDFLKWETKIQKSRGGVLGKHLIRYPNSN